MIYALPPKSAKISPQMALSRLKYEYIKSELREPRLIIMHPTDAELYMEAKQKKLTGSKCGIKELLIFDDLQIVRTVSRLVVRRGIENTDLSASTNIN